MLISRPFERETAVKGINTRRRININFTSLTWKKPLILPFAKSKRAPKFVVPISIKIIVIISIERLLYSPILLSLVENPPVEREHMAWQTPSNQVIPAMRYAIVPITRQKLYIKNIACAVFLRFGVRRSG